MKERKEKGERAGCEGKEKKGRGGRERGRREEWKEGDILTEGREKD